RGKFTSSANKPLPRTSGASSKRGSGCPNTRPLPGGSGGTALVPSIEGGSVELMATPRSCDRAILALFPTLKCANTTWERALVPFGFRTFEFVLTKREALGLDQTSSSGAGQKRSAHMVPRGTKKLRPAVAEGALKLNVDHRCWYSIRTEFLMPEIAQ